MAHDGPIAGRRASAGRGTAVGPGIDRLETVASMSAGLCHDVKNLLIAMSCQLDALNRTTANAEGRDRLGSIREELEFVQSLADDLLGFVIGAPQVPATTSLHSWWERARPLLEPMVPRHDRLEARIGERLPVVALPAHRLTQAVMNLVMNSARAVRAGGRILVWARSSRDRRLVRLGVTDDGCGMTSAAALESLTAPAAPRSGGRARGLGLWTVRTLVRAAGGSVDVESAPGAGTTVVLELPTRRSSRRSRRPALSAHPAGDDESCAALSTHGARRTRILCADDHTVVTEGLRARLDREPDLEVVKVLPSAEHLGVEASLSNADVVILDIEMPGPDPFEVARDLRTSCPHVRTVFLSAYVKDHFIDRAIEAGASGYLDKGCDPDAIVAAVRRIAAGERVLSARVAARHSTPNDLRASARSKLDRLTPREVQILAMIGHGLSRQDIAIATHRSVKTIDTHRAAIMRKLDLHDRTDLALFAVREGLVAE